MATIHLKRPATLLGRSVVGTYRSGADTYSFHGTVEAVILPLPGSTGHCVEFYVAGEYISLPDCITLDFAPLPAVSGLLH